MELMNRKAGLEQSMDPEGRTWVIKGERGNALVHARPDPDRVDAQIPKPFQGKWTSPTVLREKINVWLNQQWDKAELAQQRNLREDAAAREQQKIERKTAQESLDELPQEIKDALGDIIEEKEDGNEVKAAEEGRDTETDHNEEPTGRLADSGSQEEEAKEEVDLPDYSKHTYQELLEVAKEKGITAKKKAEIIAALEG